MKNPYFNMIGLAWRFSDDRKFFFVLSYLFFIIANSFIMLEPWVFALFINRIQKGGDGLIHDSVLILAAYASLTLFFWIFHGTARYMENINGFYIVKNFREYLFKVLTTLPLKWHKIHHSGDTMSRMAKSTQGLMQFSSNGFQYVETIVKFFGALIALLLLMPVAGILALIFGFFVAATILAFDKRLVPKWEKINKKNHKADAVFYDFVTNITTVVTLRLQKLAQSEILNKIEKILPIWSKSAKLQEWKWFSISMSLAIINFSILMLYIFSNVSAGKVVLLGSLMAIYQYTDRFISVFFDMGWKYERLVMENIDSKSVNVILEDYEKLAKNIHTYRVPKEWRKVFINGLTFRYGDEKKRDYNLKDVNIVLEKGQRIAFIGESGSGKSTMMHLLRGLDDARKVKISILNRNYNTLRCLSNIVTLIPQNPEIFKNTVSYNISAGIPHDEDEILKACELARFSSVLKRLPLGLETNVMEKGVNLSGGEKQRLALARGVFAAKFSDIVLMDEPTSSVDPQNEVKIYENLFNEFSDKCIVSSIHKLNLLPRFDYIYLFEDGRVAAEGAFEELLKQDAKFQKIWRDYEKSSVRVTH